MLTNCNLIEPDNHNTQEASTRKVMLNEEDPICVDFALKYIYGRGKQQLTLYTD